jgi:hypothetical protein
MIINLLATWIPALGIAFLGVLKLLGNSRVVEEMSKLGVGRYLRLLGVMEIAFAALFVVPATMKLGVYSRVLLLRRCDRDRAVARSFEGQSVYPDRTALDRRFHSGSLDFFLI